MVLSLEQTEQHTRRPSQRGTSSQKGIPGNGLGMDQRHCVLRTPRGKVNGIHARAHQALWTCLLPLPTPPPLSLPSQSSLGEVRGALHFYMQSPRLEASPSSSPLMSTSEMIA